MTEELIERVWEAASARPELAVELKAVVSRAASDEMCRVELDEEFKQLPIQALVMNSAAHRLLKLAHDERLKLRSFPRLSIRRLFPPSRFSESDFKAVFVRDLIEPMEQLLTSIERRADYYSVFEQSGFRDIRSKFNAIKITQLNSKPEDMRLDPQGMEFLWSLGIRQY